MDVRYMISKLIVKDLAEQQPHIFQVLEELDSMLGNEERQSQHWQQPQSQQDDGSHIRNKMDGNHHNRHSMFLSINNLGNNRNPNKVNGSLNHNNKMCP
uniref:Uncharacterized protein n=1 Tax=Acrobeloides nanus TaxID=290746 RepID=A0A914DYE5_9BILA